MKMVEVMIHGANGEAEFGSRLMPTQEAQSYIELLKGSDWFSCKGENLKVKEVITYIDGEKTEINIYTEIQ